MCASWLLLLSLVVAACGGVPSNGSDVHGSDGGSQRALGEVQYLPGEHMEWEVRWSGVMVGRVQLAVGQPGTLDGRPALVVRSLAISDGALAIAKRGQMELVTWIDVERRRPLAQSGSFDEIYSGEALGSQFGAAEWPRTPWRPGLPHGEVAHSTHSALGLLRGWQAGDGDRTHVFVRMRTKVLRIDLRVAGRERIHSALGRRSALRIDGVAVPVDDKLEAPFGQQTYPASFWIDDEGSERVPVRIEMESGYGGMVRLDLVTYDAPSLLSLTRSLRSLIATAPRASER